MFEVVDETAFTVDDFTTVGNAHIDERGAHVTEYEPWAWKAEVAFDELLADIHKLIEQAMREIDGRLGFPPSFTNRSIAQRRRFERLRQLKEQA